MIKGFIELTNYSNGKRVAIAVDSIRTISEEDDDGDFSRTLIRFKGLSGQAATNFPTGLFAVSEPYDVVRSKILEAGCD